MGRVLLVSRLVVGDLRRHPLEAVLLLVAIVAATATLTLGLVLHGVTTEPYGSTRAATAGPDVVATSASDQQGVTTPADLDALEALEHAPGVIGHSGPFPLASAVIRARGIATVVMAEGRDPEPAAIDQPKVTWGSWVRSGGVVIERTFANALGVRGGDRVTIGGKSFRVVGLAVTAAIATYPEVCSLPFCEFPYRGTQYKPTSTGLVWLTVSDARSLATSKVPLSDLINLKLEDPSRANEFANSYDSSSASTAPTLFSWQSVRDQDAATVSAEQEVLEIGSWLLGLLAVASVAVLVGGRMAEQTRRIGLIKAVGGTPRLVAMVLLSENVVLALLAAGAGLAVGRLAAPLLTSPGAGLIGAAGAPSLTLSTVELVVVVALAVALAATLVPALRAARTSTVGALADSARSPRRSAGLVGLSASLPVPLMLGLRLAARRPRRIVLCAASVAITVTMVVAVLCYHVTIDHESLGSSSQLNDPVSDRVAQVLLVVSVALALLSVVNAIFITWATVVDSRRASAIAYALGATPRQISAGLSVAQLLPSLAGALIGIPLGFGLIKAVSNGAGLFYPSASWLGVVVAGALALMALFTAIPARIGAHRPVSEILQAETA